MMLSGKELVNQYIEASVKKTQMPVEKIIGKSVMAGMMIALGAACSSVAAHSIENVGISRIVAGTVFPVGLMMVILLGAELFTGDCLAFVALADGKISVLKLVRLLALVYLGNLVGGVLLAVLISLSGQLDYSSGKLGAYTIKVALAKVSLTPMRGITSGILCNILVCAAVFIAMNAKDVTGKLLASFFVIMPFVTGGFEHCVANMYYITAGIIAKYNPSYLVAAKDIYGITDVSNLNACGFFINNLLPVTIGNIIGGAMCVGLPMYYINCKEKKHSERRRNKDELRVNYVNGTID